MKYSELREKYAGFARWSVTIQLQQHTLYPSLDIHLKSLYIEESDELTCNVARIRFEDIQHYKELFQYLQTGACIHIFLGYQKQEELVFMGYVQEINIIADTDNSLCEVEVYAQDVKGLMMLKKRAQVFSSKKRSALIKEILQDRFYQSYVKAVKLSSLPAAMDTNVFMDGVSDYEMLINVCKENFYSCYVAHGILYLGKPHESNGKSLCIDTWQDMHSITQKTSMENQIGALTIMNCDGFQKKQKIEDTYMITDMPQSQAMREVLHNTEAIWIKEDYHSMEEMQYALHGYKQEIKNSYGRIIGKGAMLPDLECGMEVSIQLFCDRKVKTGVLCHIEHRIDEDGACSEWEAVLLKG